MTKPRKPRSIDFLSPEQLQRKREFDRNSARLTRERTKAYIQNLELRVQQLERQNYDLEQRLVASSSQNATSSASSDSPQVENDKNEAAVVNRNVQSQALTTIAGGGDRSGQAFDNDLLQVLGFDHLGKTEDHSYRCFV